MTIKDLQGVLCGMVTLYEEKPNAETGIYQDLYCGMSQEIPAGLMGREVLIASPVRRQAEGAVIDIQLKTVHKKAYEKSPA